MAAALSGSQRAILWYPPAYDIRVETVPIPQIIDPDDAIVKIKLAGLCGSDLHIYRGHEDIDKPFICGHELIGEVVALGSSFHPNATGRPELYSTLQVGDKIVSPFTVTCGECHFCRVGSTSRCIHSTLFGTPSLPGGQEQYARIPKAGGTLYNLNALSSAPLDVSEVAESSLLLLADILPTGVFAALQVLQHPKLSPMLTGLPYPWSSNVPSGYDCAGMSSAVRDDDRSITIAVVGLGPVGVCATVSLLDMLASLQKERGITYRVVAIDPNESRRTKMQAVHTAIDAKDKLSGEVVVTSIEEGKRIVAEWTDNAGCNAVLEVVGNNSALTLSYELVCPFGVISSVGVHQEPPLPFTGREMYAKNVSFDFGRCPVRAMFPIALEILLRRQDVFGTVGETTSLIDKIVGLDQAAETYEMFDKGKCGKVLFDPWL